MNPPDYSTAIILLEIKRPVPIAELAAITDALTRLHGPALLMRQSGPYLQIFKPRPATSTKNQEPRTNNQ
jgi:hypothetical protein